MVRKTVSRMQSTCGGNSNSEAAGMSENKTKDKIDSGGPVGEIRASIRERIYFAAKDGFSLVLCTLLNELDDGLRYMVLNDEYSADDVQTLTPLTIAAKHGHFQVVHMLLTQFKVNVNQACNIYFDGHMVERASPLWIAAGVGRLNVVKLLVESGAEVDAKTKSNSTPLRVACAEGRADVVQYLVKHGADVNAMNIYNNTCLMMASYKGHTGIVEFLLQQGADVDVMAKCRATALHYAAEIGHADICKLILEYGAALQLNEYAMKPVIVAADKTRVDVVELFCSWPNLLTKREKIDALELLGASFANDKDNYSLRKAHQYLTLAMNMRYEDPDDEVKKQLLPPVPAYQNWVECQTKGDLLAIRFNHNSLHMEALAIRERILGVTCPEIVHPVIFRGAVYADNGRFDRCEDLWMHALMLRKNLNISIQRDLLRFAQVFSQMILLKEKLRFHNIVSVLDACITEIETNVYKILNPNPKDDIAFILEENELNTVTVLYLLTITTKCIKLPEVEVDPADVAWLHRLVIKLNKMDIRLRDGQSLLHLAVNGTAPVDDFHTNEVCTFPCVDTVRLLLYCGANLLVFDIARNSPLHTLVATMQNARAPEPEQIVTFQELLQLFHKYGLHFDSVNCDGIKAISLTASPTTEQLIRQYEVNELNLKCLASRTIAQNKVLYRGEVPKDLIPIIELHCAETKAILL